MIFALTRQICSPS